MFFERLTFTMYQRHTFYFAIPLFLIVVEHIHQAMAIIIEILFVPEIFVYFKSLHKKPLRYVQFVALRIHI